MKAACTLVAALALAVPAAAQTPANPLTAATKSTFDLIKGNITKSAEKVLRGAVLVQAIARRADASARSSATSPMRIT